MNCPGSVSKSLLVVSGSVDSVCNSAAIIEEMMVAFGREHRKPERLGACVMRSANSCVSEDLDGVHEIPSAITLDFVSTQPER